MENKKSSLKTFQEPLLFMPKQLENIEYAENAQEYLLEREEFAMVLNNKLSVLSSFVKNLQRLRSGGDLYEFFV